MNLTQAWAVIKEILGVKPPKVNRRKKLSRKPQAQNVPEKKVEEKVSNDAYLIIPNFDRQLPMKSPATLATFAETHKKVFNRFVFFSLRHAIKNNLREIVLFKLGESNLLGKIEFNNFEAALEKLEAAFLEVQDYEYIEPCRKLLDQHYINRVINESQQ